MTIPPADMPPETDKPPLASDAGGSHLADVPVLDREEPDSDDMNPDAAILAHPEWGSVSMLAAAASFGTIVPSAVAAAHEILFRTLELHGEGSLTNGGGRLTKINGIEYDAAVKAKEGDNDSDDESGWDQYVENAERRAEREREMREQWSRDEHEYAGVSMTGEEWGQLATELSKGGKLRQWLVAKIKKDGKTTDAEAETLADKVALRTKMNSLPPALWTDDMKALDREMQADPALKTQVDGYVQKASAQTGHAFGPRIAAEEKAMKDQTVESVATGSDLLDAEPTRGASQTVLPTSATRDLPLASTTAASRPATNDFPTAPDLTAHHQAAVAAVTPLDAPKPPTVIASAPAPAGSAGLDV